jgi:hypothetical protein
MKKGILQRCSRNWEEAVMGKFKLKNDTGCNNCVMLMLT